MSSTGKENTDLNNYGKPMTEIEQKVGHEEDLVKGDQGNMLKKMEIKWRTNMENRSCHSNLHFTTSQKVVGPRRWRVL